MADEESTETTDSPVGIVVELTGSDPPPTGCTNPQLGHLTFDAEAVRGIRNWLPHWAQSNKTNSDSDEDESGFGVSLIRIFKFPEGFLNEVSADGIVRH